jgi:hypothetical protein
VVILTQRVNGHRDFIVQAEIKLNLDRGSHGKLWLSNAADHAGAR